MPLAPDYNPAPAPAPAPAHSTPAPPRHPRPAPANPGTPQVDYLNLLDRIYVFDGFAGWDPEAGGRWTGGGRGGGRGWWGGGWGGVGVGAQLARACAAVQ